MRFKTKKRLIATSLALALSSFGTAHAADIISFDADGTGGVASAQNIGAFDWAVASTLADNTNPNIGQDYNIYFHTSLQGFQNTNGGPAGSPAGLNSSYEITVIGGFSEKITSLNTGTAANVNFGLNGVDGGNDDVLAVTQTVTFGAGSGTSFIRMFYDSTIESDAIAGTGYDDGTRILDAIISSVTGTFSAVQRFIDVNNNNLFDAGDIAQGFLLDNFDTDNWAGQLSVSGDGSTTLLADVLFFDPTFFLTALSQLTQDVNFTTQNNVPFNQTNPSKCFDTDNTIAGGSTVGLAVSAGGCGSGMSLGSINGGFLGGAGPDVLLQTDASTSFKRATVPEPSVLMLLGIGLIGLAASRRKTRV